MALALATVEEGGCEPHTNAPVSGRTALGIASPLETSWLTVLAATARDDNHHDSLRGPEGPKQSPGGTGGDCFPSAGSLLALSPGRLAMTGEDGADAADTAQAMLGIASPPSGSLLAVSLAGSR